MTDTPNDTTDITTDAPEFELDADATTDQADTADSAASRSNAVTGSSSPEAIAELAAAAGSNPNFIPNDLDRVPDKAFRDYKLDDRLVDALEAKGITHPFPIQELTLPVALQGQDIIGQARTGTGKTLGFGLPMLQQMDPEASYTQCLVVTPTRELCIQVYEELRIGEVMGITSHAVYGGVGYDEQTEALQNGVHVVVGTPGRLLDMLNRRILDLSRVKVVILDEADEMLDMGFLPDVERLLAAAGDQATRHTMLFSATMPATVVKLARRYTNNPLFMGADTVEHETAPTVEQHFFQVFRMDKPRVLARILQQPDRENVYVFCRTKAMCDRLVRELEDLGTDAIAIHGDLRQAAREKNLDKFRSGAVSVLVATEVAARGIDVDNVTHVINYDLPDDEKMYLHRIGRTARAGNKGCAISFAEHNEIGRLTMIKKAVQQLDEVQEVFSTSPLLQELFNLPDETPWGSFVKNAKSGGGQRSSNRPPSRESGRDGGSRGGRDSGGRGGRDDNRGARDGGRNRDDSKKREDAPRERTPREDAPRERTPRERTPREDAPRERTSSRDTGDQKRERTSSRDTGDQK
ncbi:MAG: superfamily II DNA/RNA helicase, partial [Myxococcota bacterium]